MDITPYVDPILAWLAGLQTANGAFPMFPLNKAGDKSKVCPYFSEFAGLALLLKPEVYGSCVRGYLDWHFRHLNTAEADYNGEDGTIYDYELTLQPDGSVTEEILHDSNTGTLSYDSTDSYAGLFLELLWEYGRTTGDTAYILRHAPEVHRIYRAMLCTLDNGLTWAKPDYHAKYLMDNCEVYKGLTAAEKLYGLYDASGVEKELAQNRMEEIPQYKTTIFEAIETILWDENAQCYAVGATDVRQRFPEVLDWDKFYPDALAQLFPIVMGLLPPEHPRARYLYDTFNVHYSGEDADWVELRGEKLAPFLNGLIPYTAAYMGDTQRMERFLETYRVRFIETGHPFPAYNADCAQVALAAHKLWG